MLALIGIYDSQARISFSMYYVMYQMTSPKQEAGTDTDSYLAQPVAHALNPKCYTEVIEVIFPVPLTHTTG